MQTDLLLERFDDLLTTSDDVAYLEAAILQLAVRGKLVPQDPDDEPVGVLFERIKVKKKQLVEEGRIPKPRKTPSTSPKDIPYELPQGWIWCRLNEICSRIADIDHNMPKAVDAGGVKFISAKDLLNDGTLNLEHNVKHISEEDYQRLSRKIAPQRGDIIYSRIGAKLGKARVVETDERFLVSYSCCTIRPILVDIWYLNRYLDSGIVLQQALRDTQSIGVPDLGMRKIREFLVPLPPLAEQKRIVAKVDALLAQTRALAAQLEGADAALVPTAQAAFHSLLDAPDTASRSQAWQRIVHHLNTLTSDPRTIKALKQTILQLAVQGKLVPQDPEDEPASVLVER
ncbi:MAG: type I restriction endonuclease subunit S, partial [Chloroflexi bacterium]|nr:type I restriction endonuclease subunit S [Chloroflexota bacterium]